MNITIHTKIILTNINKQILLIKRSYGNKKRDLPGGALELPETIEDCIMRELKEETGITHVHSLQVIDSISSYNKDEDNYVVFIGYKGSTPEHNIHLSAEHEQYMRATREEAIAIGLTPYLIDFIHKS